MIFNAADLKCDSFGEETLTWNTTAFLGLQSVRMDLVEELLVVVLTTTIFGFIIYFLFKVVASINRLDEERVAVSKPALLEASACYSSQDYTTKTVYKSTSEDGGSTPALTQKTGYRTN